ncbi:MAG: caspase family protein, partial [Candidatus Eremiobacterota bacterium]
RWFFVPGKKEYFFSETLCLQEGTNKITINAADAGKEQITKTITVIYTLPKPQNWAVVIGIRDYYSSHIDDLKYSDSDAMSVYEYLITGRGFAEDHVMLLLNEKATLKEIKIAIGIFLREKVLKHDSVFIYYSGYGSIEIDPLNKDGDGISTYLLPYDTDPCNLYGTALSTEDITIMLNRIKGKETAFLIDSSFSGQGGKTFANPKTGYMSDKFLNNLSSDTGHLVVTAADITESALESEKLGHGIFTYYLLEGLQKNNYPDRNSFIEKINEAYDYIFDKTVRESDDRQHPLKKRYTVR